MVKQWVKISDILFFQEGPGVRNTQYTTEGVKLLNVANLVDGKVDLSTSDRFISEEEAYGKYKHFLCDEGDFIVASSGIKVDYLDKKMGFIKKEMLPLCMNTSTIRFKVLDKDQLDIRYFMYYVKSQHYKNQVAFHITGSAQLNYGPSHLKKMIMPLISIIEQKRIVKVLDAISDIIETRQRQLQKLDNLVKARFIELFGTVKDNPCHFPTATLKEVCHKITDGKHGGCEQEADSGYYYVGAREIYDGAIHYETAPQITYADFAKDYRRCNIEQGDMVIVNTGATIGKSAIASSPLTERTLLQKSVALLKVKTDVISAEFLRYCYMANPSMYMVESASAQPNLLLSKMNATVIYLPPLELQQQFAAFVEQTDKSKVVVQKALDEAQTLFDRLMQEYFG